MFKKISVFLSVCLLSSGCILPENHHIIEAVREHLHRDVGSLIIEIGSPTSSVKTKNGNYYTWVKEAKKPGTIHGYHYRDPFTELVTSGAYENIVEKEPQEMVYECKLTVGTNKNDIITSYHLSGECNTLNTFLD